MFSKTKSAPPENKAATLIAPDTRTPSSSAAPATSSARSSVSVIGAHTQVEGDINSDEDLTVEGRVSGIITCKQHTVTLGANGAIEGDVFAQTLHISGQVTGNLVAHHRATIHKGAQVSGTIIAPCLVLEDGSVFHGSIDMNPDNDELKSAFGNATGSTTKASATSSAPEATSMHTVDKRPATSANAADQDKAEAND